MSWWRIATGLAVLLIALGGPHRAPAQQTSGQFIDRIYTDADGDHKYVVFLPAGYTPAKKWPMVVYLHGASARGRDGRAQLVAGLAPAVKLRADWFPFICVFPQCESFRGRLLGGWSEYPEDADRALRIVDVVESEYSVDRDHEILTGVSMGAFGVWSIAARTAERWAAILPISGGKPEFVEQLKKIPTWAFHAANDAAVVPEESQKLVDGINAAGGRAYLSILPSGGHNIGAPVYAQDEVYEWMRDPSQEPQLDIDWTQPTERADGFDDVVTFVPGAEVSGAVHLHIGNDLLESLAYTFPDQVPAEALKGSRPAVRQTTRTLGIPFEVTLSGIAYSGTLERATLRPLADNRLLVQLGLRNLWMTIGHTRLDGGLLNVSAGRMSVVIGHRAPVWLSVAVRPRVEGRRLRLDLVGASFQIPDHNWYVTRPRSVRVRPLPLFQNRISARLADGVRERKHEIERQLVSSIPAMLAQLEERIDGLTGKTISFGNWPMPLWQPRFRFWPERVAIDPSGVSVTLGTTVAALAPKSDTIPIESIEPMSLAPPPLEPDGLDVLLSRQIMETWSLMLAQSDVGRLSVYDLNVPPFERFVEREYLEQVVPDFKQYRDTEFTAEMIVLEPFQIGRSGAGDGVADGFDLHIPKVRLAIDLKNGDNAPFRPYVHFDFALTQGFRFSVTESGHRRAISFGRRGDLAITATGGFADGYEPSDATLDVERVRRQFLRGWNGSFREGGREIKVKDQVIAEVPLRFTEVGWINERLLLRMERPPTRIANVSSEPLVYQVRGPFTVWSAPLTIPPGDFHEYRDAYPLFWKLPGDRVEQFRLPLGYSVESRTSDADGLPVLVRID